MRIDVLLVQKGLTKNRSKAKQLIENGQVYVCGVKASKCGLNVCEEDEIEIRGEINPFVSKGGLKLEKAISSFLLDFKDKVIVDIGASTGGFTDCAILHGASKVYAIDVGKGQLDEKLLNDDRVMLYEDTDFRLVDNELIKDADFAIADVSFISIIKLLPKLCELKFPFLVFLIKPQFECGIKTAKKYKGVIKNKEEHKKVLQNVLSEFKNSGYYATQLTFSPITGGDGNIEYIAKFEYASCYDESLNETFVKVLNLCDVLVEDAFNNFSL
ncbi:MAG: TlyA family RNA methyltransferase [Clostridia bacterium]|nr:TlyA family RNA methyltransferase [Clostridia bacterium]